VAVGSAVTAAADPAAAARALIERLEHLAAARLGG
jgi:thiamine monophosphate synthase